MKVPIRVKNAAAFSEFDTCKVISGSWKGREVDIRKVRRDGQYEVVDDNGSETVMKESELKFMR